MKKVVLLALIPVVFSVAMAADAVVTPPVNSPVAPSGLILAYNSTGLFSGGKVWLGETQTNAAGDFSADITAAECSTIPLVQVTAITNSAQASNAAQATITTRTPTAISGFVVRPVTLLSLGLTMAKVPAGTPVMVIGMCS